MNKRTTDYIVKATYTDKQFSKHELFVTDRPEKGTAYAFGERKLFLSPKKDTAVKFGHNRAHKLASEIMKHSGCEAGVIECFTPAALTREFHNVEIVNVFGRGQVAIFHNYYPHEFKLNEKIRINGEDYVIHGIEGSRGLMNPDPVKDELKGIGLVIKKVDE